MDGACLLGCWLLVSEPGDGLCSSNQRLGALRHLVRPGSKADAHVDIVALTNSTILPLVNSLLDLDLNAATAKVSQLVNEVVRIMSIPPGMS